MIPGVLGDTSGRSMQLDGGADDGNNYVFLQKFPLQFTGGLIFHTEVVVCPKSEFSSEDQLNLDEWVLSLEGFKAIDDSWWSSRTAACVELGYGGASASEPCSGVPFGPSNINFPLNARRAVIGNADVSKKSLFLYGTGSLCGTQAYHATCDKGCWSKWAGTDYNPLTNNCNTFTSAVLSCVYGLSEEKPNLGPSDMVSVTCDGKCPLPPSVLVKEEQFSPKPSRDSFALACHDVCSLLNI